ncbi:MAG TPA: arginine--tRNA ligase [Candidatus Paceibacterota bacterium]|nr:arginine--tRNA ligase [Candidatus Paceibacterota bacterium]
MKENLEQALRGIAKELGIPEVAFSVEHPKELSHGDYATNLPLVAAKQLGKSPKEIAELVKKKLLALGLSEVESVTVAGAGFVNITLTSAFFTSALAEILHTKEFGKNNSLAGKKVLIEYTQPNPFKPFHIGHLMSNSIGESLTRIFEWSGAKVVRANYQGDVGLHVAKAIYGLMQKPMPEKLAAGSIAEQAAYIGTCYAQGSSLYDESAEAKQAIDAINKQVYDRSDESVNKLYEWGRKVTLLAFEGLYQQLGTTFDHYFFESEMATVGLPLVQENKGNVFEESDGAIVFHAETYNPKLHTRVFITSAGLPTYETKELGLTKTKFETINPDLSIVLTAVEQVGVIQVVREAVRLINPAWAEKMLHVTHGMMRFASGKMSSRKGNVITGESLLRDAEKAVLEKMQDRAMAAAERQQVAELVGTAAIKYSILKQATGSDIVFDFEKSISFDGDSGPYLQYSVTRAKSVLAKAAALHMQSKVSGSEQVTVLEKLLCRFPAVVMRVQAEREPHYLTTFLTELASAFNAFYGAHQIVGEGTEYQHRLAVTEAFVQVMERGLWLLGISVPEKM